MDVAAFEEIETGPPVLDQQVPVPGVGGAIVQPATAFVAPAGECVMFNHLNETNSDFVIYHKQYPGLKTPFDLPIECFPEYEAMLDEDPTCVDTVNVMLRGAVAKSTASNYKSVINRFHAFCTERGQEFPVFQTGAVLRFVKDSYEEGAGLGFFNKVIPALAMLEELMGAGTSALTGVVKQAVKALKRELAQNRGIVKKATGYSFRIIQVLVEREVLPHWAEPYKIDAANFRAIFRAVIIYCTLCRFDDFCRLQDKHFSDNGDHVQIIFERSKNDQFGDNSKSVIVARPEAVFCPVQLIRLYFQKFELKFNGSGKSVNFRLQKQAGSHRPLWYTSLAQSNATKATRQLLVKHGFDGAKFTEKSLKVQGVTELLDAGVSLENVMVLGRWKRTTTPLHYRNLSANFLLTVAGRLPM